MTKIVTNRMESLKAGDVIVSVGVDGAVVERKIPQPTYRVVEVFRTGAVVTPGSGFGFAAENGMGYWHLNTISTINTGVGSTWEALVDSHNIAAYIEYGPKGNGVNV